jgi:hypothetical protein
MTVFVLLWSVPYEGSSLLGVYSTRERALDAWDVWAEESPLTSSAYDPDIREVDLDSVADLRY